MGKLFLLLISWFVFVSYLVSLRKYAGELAVWPFQGTDDNIDGGSDGTDDTDFRMHLNLLVRIFIWAALGRFWTCFGSL